uniref:Uncharacterized protein n=1 Tax=Anguilla anguilla TaxID=7936 RepID=A0A0E9QNU7_ANGAN
MLSLPSRSSLTESIAKAIMSESCHRVLLKTSVRVPALWTPPAVPCLFVILLSVP